MRRQTFFGTPSREHYLGDLDSLKGAAEPLRLTAPAAAAAIAEIIEAGEEPGKPAPIIRWLVAALRGPLVARLHWSCHRESADQFIAWQEEFQTFCSYHFVRS